MIGEFQKEDFIRNIGYECPRCHRLIVNCYDERYALKSSLLYEDENVCPYCKLEEIEMMPLSDEESELYDFILKNGLTKEEFIKYKAKNEGIDYIRTENNIAAIYVQNYDKKFFYNNGGENPFLKYYLKKEVCDQFKILSTFDDYYSKYEAYIYISECEETEKYNEEINNLETYIEENFPDKIKKDRSMQEKISDDLLDRFGGFIKSLSAIEDSRAKETYITSMVKLIQLIDDKKYELNGEIINIENLMEPSVNVHLADFLHGWLGNFDYEIVVLYFEHWKITRSDDDLRLCLMYLNKYFESYYCFITLENKHLDFYEINDYKITNCIDLLEKMVNEFVGFYRYYDRKYHQLPYDKIYSQFGIFNKPKSSLKLRYNDYRELSEDGFVMVLANMSEYIKLLYLIINKLKLNLSYEYVSHEIGSKERIINSSILSRVEDIYSIFNGAYSKIIRTLYSNKVYSNNDVDSQQKIILVMKMLIDFLDDFEDYNDLDFAFKSITELKSAILSNYIDSEFKEEIENILDKFIIRLVELTRNSKNTNEEYLDWENRLKLEFIDNKKYKYIEGDIFNTLSTAEFLFEKYVVENESKDVADRMDYSCISILYYSALEKLLNNCIYKRYREMLINRGFQTINDLKSRLEIYERYFPTNKIKRIESTFYNTKGLNESLTIGGLYYFFKIDAGSKPQDYISFFSDIFSLKVDIENAISYLCKGLYNIRGSRNSAAHGGDFISIDKVKVDKQNVFEIEQAKEYKRLLSKTLEFLK